MCILSTSTNGSLHRQAYCLDSPGNYADREGARAHAPTLLIWRLADIMGGGSNAGRFPDL